MDDLESDSSGEDSDTPKTTFLLLVCALSQTARQCSTWSDKNEGIIEMMDQVTRACHVRRLRTHLQVIAEELR